MRYNMENGHTGNRTHWKLVIVHCVDHMRYVVLQGSNNMVGGQTTM